MYNPFGFLSFNSCSNPFSPIFNFRTENINPFPAYTPPQDIRKNIFDLHQDPTPTSTPPPCHSHFFWLSVWKEGAATEKEPSETALTPYFHQTLDKENVGAEDIEEVIRDHRLYNSEEEVLICSYTCALIIQAKRNSVSIRVQGKEGDCFFEFVIDSSIHTFHNQAAEFLCQILRKMNFNAEDGVYNLPNGEIYFGTPALMAKAAERALAMPTPNPYEETPSRPRRSKRSTNKSQFLVPKTPAPASFSQGFLNATEKHAQLQGTLFENVTPMKVPDFNMADFINDSPIHTAYGKTPATRNLKSRLNQVLMPEATPTKPMDFVFQTPSHGLKWNENEENQEPDFERGPRTITKSFNPRMFQVEQDEEDDLTPLSNVKTRSKPFTKDERSSKRICSGEVSPVNGRLPLHDIESSLARDSMSSEDLVEGDQSGDCLVLSRPGTAQRLETREHRNFTEKYRNFSAVSPDIIKSFTSPISRPYSPPRSLPRDFPEPQSLFTPPRQFSEEETVPPTENVYGRLVANANKLRYSTATHEAPSDSDSDSDSSVAAPSTPRATKAYDTTPAAPAIPASPSRIPIRIIRRRGQSDPPAPPAHFRTGETLIPLAAKSKIFTTYKPSTAVVKLPQGTPKGSLLRAPTLSTLLKQRSFEPKQHRRSVSDSAGRTRSPSVTHTEISEEDQDLMDTDEYKALPNSKHELKKLLLKTHTDLKGEKRAREEAERTVEFMKTEYEFYKMEIERLKSEVAAPRPASPVKSVAGPSKTTTAIKPVVKHDTDASTSSRTNSAGSSISAPARPMSSLSATRATRPPVQGNGSSSGSTSTHRPPSRGSSRTTNTSRLGTRSSALASAASTRPGSAASQRPTSSLSRPVRRK